MLRLLIFLLSAVFVAFAVTALLDVESRFALEIFGQKVNMSAGLALGVLALAAVLLVVGTSAVKDLAVLPQRLKEKRDRSRMERGMTALTRGLEAVAAGDAADAQHHARLARRTLGEGSMTRLLTAQAAQLSGDEETAGESFAAMLDAPETEFLGLRGLYAKAMRAGDRDAARGYAERAFRLRPHADWAFESVFELALDRGAWGEARAALDPAVRNRAAPQDRAKRAEAALLAAAAHASDAAGDHAAALEDAGHALKLDAGFAPAAVLAAGLHARQGRMGKAQKILENAFAKDPHQSIVSAYVRLHETAPPAKIAAGLNRLADRNPDARESAVARARAHVLSAEHANAIAVLEPLLAETATARECALMADAVAGAHGTAAAQPWLQRAAAAERDPTPGADGVFRFTRDGWAQLIREYMAHGRLAPPPAEGPPAGISSDEIRLLIAPPPAPEDAPEDASEETSETMRDEPPQKAASETVAAEPRTVETPDEKPTAAPREAEAPVPEPRPETESSDAAAPEGASPADEQTADEAEPDASTSPDALASKETSETPASTAAVNAEINEPTDADERPENAEGKAENKTEDADETEKAAVSDSTPAPEDGSEADKSASKA